MDHGESELNTVSGFPVKIFPGVFKLVDSVDCPP